MKEVRAQERLQAAIPVQIAGVPDSESDAAVARFLERFLADERPGTSWTVDPQQRRRAA